MLHTPAVFKTLTDFNISAPSFLEKDRRWWSHKGGGIFKLRFLRGADSTSSSSSPSPQPRLSSAEVFASSRAEGGGWGPQEVGAWLEGLQLQEYADAFIRHDIHGAELLTLERRDLKDLGVGKVGHIKRIQQAIRRLKHLPAGDDAEEKTSVSTAVS